MLPSIIFGSLFGDGTDAPNGITDDAVMTQRMYDLNTGISTILSEGLSDVLARIDADFSASDCDEKEVNNPYGSDIVFNANHFIAMYCASKDSDAQSISQEDMEAVLRAHKAELYSFTYTDETRTEEVVTDEETGESETVTKKIRIYTVTYNGEMHFADHVFQLSDEQKTSHQITLRTCPFFSMMGPIKLFQKRSSLPLGSPMMAWSLQMVSRRSSTTTSWMRDGGTYPTVQTISEATHVVQHLCP